MTNKLLMGATRGLAPAVIMAATAAVGGVIFGAVKTGRSIHKYAQKTKAGKNSVGKLFRDIEAKGYTYKSGDKNRHNAIWRNGGNRKTKRAANVTYWH